MTVTLTVVRPGAMTSVGTPTTEHGIEWRTEKNGPGAGQFSIVMADDPTYGDIQINDIARVAINLENVVGLLIEKINERTLDSQGAARETATYLCRTVNALMEWAIIEPYGGHLRHPIEEDAVFDSSSLRYDPANDPWEAATEMMTVTAAKAGGWPTTPMGQSFTDSTGAMMLWDRAPGVAFDQHPAGTCLFYRDVEITTAGRYGLEVLFDNDGPVRANGIDQLDISQTEGYHRASFKRMNLSEGTVRLWFAVRNIDGPGALAYNLFKTDHQDRPMPGVAVVAKSDSSTFVLPYPDPLPGMTVTEILLDLLGEAQDRGCLTWIDPNFTVDEDSNGDPMERVVGITTKTGTTTLLQFLDELVSAGHISQWRIRPDGITFDVFGPDYESATTVTLAPAPATDPRTGQVVELDRQIT